MTALKFLPPLIQAFRGKLNRQQKVYSLECPNASNDLPEKRVFLERPAVIDAQFFQMPPMVRLKYKLIISNSTVLQFVC